MATEIGYRSDACSAGPPSPMDVELGSRPATRVGLVWLKATGMASQNNASDRRRMCTMIPIDIPSVGSRFREAVAEYHGPPSRTYPAFGCIRVVPHSTKEP